MKCPKCNKEMHSVRKPHKEGSEIWYECPHCEDDKLVLKDVIGGLEKKEFESGSAKTIDGMVKEFQMEGHNQLCNREVEFDEKDMLKAYCSCEIVDCILNNGDECLNHLPRITKVRRISKAIEQGKVVKLKKEVENV